MNNIYNLILLKNYDGLYQRIFIFAFLSFVAFIPGSWAQPSELTPNLQTPMITVNLPDLTVNTGGTFGTSTNDETNMTDIDLENYATLSILLTGNRWIEVVDNLAAGEDGFPAGSYAGVVFDDVSLVGIGVTYTIATYLGSTKQEERNSTALLGSGLLSGQQQIGFLTTLPFDAIRFTYASTLGVLSSIKVYYTIVQKFEAGPTPPCNLYTNWSNSDYPVAINPTRTGVTGLLTLADLVNTEAIVSPSTNDYSVLTPGILTVLSTASISVQSQVGDMTGGQLVGFELENTDILGLDLLENTIISTYLDGSYVESKSGPNLLAGVNLLDGGDRYTVSMLTTAPFDEVVITFSVPVSVDLGTTRIYNAFIKEFCEGPPLACNTMTSMDEEVYPWYFNSSNSGLLCASCSVADLSNIVDGDPNTAATVDITAAVGAGITLAFVDPLTPYPANTFVGFDIGANPLLSVDVLNFVELKLYNNGALVKDANNAGLLAGVSTLLLTGTGPNRSVIGFVSDVAFDEVRITFNNTVGVNLGLIKVYDLVLQSGCGTTLVCSEQNPLTSPKFPTVINFERTGTFGGVCVGCQVDNPWNVITPSLADVARLEVTVGALEVASLSVLDPVNTYYPGTYTGFVIKQDGMPIGLNLLSGLTVTTYNNGVMQESVTAASLLDLTVLGILIINPPPDPAYILGFKATKPFDEVRLSLSNAVSAFNVINVYYAFIDNTEAVFSGGVTPSICFKTNPDFNVTSVNTLVNGSVATNDIIVDGPATYGNPISDPNNPTGATLNINVDGTYDFTATTPGVYIYSVEVCRAGQTSNCAHENLTITVNDPMSIINPPIANTDIVGMNGPGPVTIPVRDNDTGGNPGSTLTEPIPGALLPSNGTVDMTGGVVQYTPDPGFYGVDSFSYIICDVDQPTLCSEALVVVTIYPPEMANTTTAADDFVFTPEGEPISGNVLDNDFDKEGNTQTVVPVSQMISGVGTLVVNADGTFTFTPEVGFTGPYNFPLTIIDDGTPIVTAMSTLYILVENSSPLPVNLLSFQARQEGNVALMTWTTTFEINSARFDIEHSADQKSWTIIGNRLAAGHTTTQSNYAFTHQTPSKGVNYYRLRSIDDNGASAVSEIRSVNFGMTGTVEVSPNPTKGDVKLYGTNSGDQITVYNTLGRLVIKTTASAQNHRLDLSSFPDGVYRIVVESSSGEYYTEKVIKMAK